MKSKFEGGMLTSSRLINVSQMKLGEIRKDSATFNELNANTDSAMGKNGRSKTYTGTDHDGNSIKKIFRE